jgi:hypothetical protein
MDPLIVQSYQIGIVLGILILSTLILFPGRKETAASRDDPLTNDDPTSSRTTSNRSRKVKDDDDTGNMAQQQYWTPHRRLNAVVYIFILVVLFYVLLYSYTDHSVPHHRQQLQHPTTLLKVLFKTYFPKEAALVWK